jgi:hypothetical protein
LEKLSTGNKKSNDLLKDFVEGLLYALVTLLFYVVPFVIPGITMKQGGMIFFGEVILLFIGIVIFSIVINRKIVSRPSRKKHH